MYNNNNNNNNNIIIINLQPPLHLHDYARGQPTASPEPSPPTYTSVSQDGHRAIIPQKIQDCLKRVSSILASPLHRRHPVSRDSLRTCTRAGRWPSSVSLNKSYGSEWRTHVLEDPVTSLLFLSSHWSVGFSSANTGTPCCTVTDCVNSPRQQFFLPSLQSFIFSRRRLQRCCRFVILRQQLHLRAQQAA